MRTACTNRLETMSLTKSVTSKLSTAKRAMERRMLGISLRERKRNECIRQQAKMRDVVQEAAEMQWTWVMWQKCA